jgi:hypothetical protein
MRKMNTAVKYKTPTIHNKYGHYQSRTNMMDVGDYIAAHVIIDIWWSQCGPWSYTVEVMTHLDRARGFHDTSHLEGGRRMCVLDNSNWPCPRDWNKGTDLAECAFAAEEEAKAMCAARGIENPAFVPYILLKDKMKKVEADMRRIEKKHWKETRKLLATRVTL